MGEVLAIFKIYPKDINIDLNKIIDELKKALPENIKIARTEEEPIAFGLKVLKVAMIMPEDLEGGTSTIEDTILKLPQVSQVEVEYVTRV